MMIRQAMTYTTTSRLSDPKLLSSFYGIQVAQTFEELLVSKEVRDVDFLTESHVVPVIPDEYFKDVEEHLRPRNDSTAQQRYDTAVKLLIRDCIKQRKRVKSSIKKGQRTGSFYLFLQTREMVEFYKIFGHNSIIFMDSGFRVNRNAFPITFISVLDNFMRGRMVAVMISQFTDEYTYSKCLSKLRGECLHNIVPSCSITEFDI